MQNEQQQNALSYNEVIQNLTDSITDKKKSMLFLDSLKTLRDSFKIDITTSFLYSLFQNDGYNAKLKNRMQYLLKKNNIKTTEILTSVKKPFSVKRIVSVCGYATNQTTSFFNKLTDENEFKQEWFNHYAFNVQTLQSGIKNDIKVLYQLVF